MPERLPPLTALRAFDAAARHLSFAQAAEELHVTPAALSFQIKTLEEHLGAPVFHRLNRAVALTETGQLLAIGAREGFAALNAAWRGAKRRCDHSSLTITAGPAFTAKWLAPRLFNFSRAHPEIELRFTATLRLLDFERDDIDVAIRFGEGNDQGLYSKDIIHEWMTPMMTPALALQYPAMADLKNAVLLHQDDLAQTDLSITWTRWFEIAGLSCPPQGGPRFSQADHALDAAISGSGVILGRHSLAETALRNGQLVAPYDLGVRLTPRYRLLCPLGTQDRPQVRVFLEWIEKEVSQMYQDPTPRRFIDQRGA